MQAARSAVEPVEDDALHDVAAELAWVARILEMHLSGVRRAERELDNDKDSGCCEERGEDLHANSLRRTSHASSAAPAANPAARRKSGRNARVIESSIAATRSSRADASFGSVRAPR